MNIKHIIKMSIFATFQQPYPLLINLFIYLIELKTSNKRIHV